MKPYYSLTSLVISIVLLSAGSCKDDSSVLCDPTPQFSANEFLNQIESRLESQPIIGYQFAVNVDGNLFHEQSMGLARHQNDPAGPINIDSGTRFNTASIAKFLATIVLLNAMEEYSISLDYDIMDYLPPTWHDLADPGHQYTFKELLTHQTAINFQHSNSQTENEMLQSFIAPPNANNLGYQNGNFNLVRVLIGEIVYGLEVDDSGNYANTNICTDKYNEYLEQKIIFPLNLTCPSSASELNDYYSFTPYPYAYQYPFNPSFTNPADGSLGWGHSNNPYTTGGAAGLMLSALDIAEIIGMFKHDESELIISELRRNHILDFELGLNNSVSGENGRYQCKRGTRGPDNCCNRAIQSILMFFPNGVEAVIITNSRHNTLDALLRDAYDASWINPC